MSTPDLHPVGEVLRESERAELAAAVGEMVAKHGAMAVVEALERTCDDLAWEYRHVDTGRILKHGAGLLAGVADFFHEHDALAGRK